MTDKLKPCHCGYEGALAGTDHGPFLSLICPECRRSVDAFTLPGLADAWNKPPNEVQSSCAESLHPAAT